MSDDVISRREAEEDVLIMARRLAWLHQAYARTMVDQLGEEKAVPLIRQAIDAYGRRAGKLARRFVEERELPLTPENMGKSPDLPKLGWEKDNLKDQEGRPVPVITRCPLAVEWQAMGEEKLGRLYCYVDQAKAEGFNPELICTHEQNVLDGDPVCQIVTRKRDS